MSSYTKSFKYAPIALFISGKAGEKTMVKRCIGIDIGSSYLCAVQITRIDEDFCIEKVFGTQIRRCTDSPGEVLKPLFSQYGFDRHADVAISIPHDAVFFRNLETDLAGLEQIRERNWSAMEHNFPVEAEQIVAQSYSEHPLQDGKYSVLTAASARTSLRERLNILAEAKMHPCLADAAIFAVHATIAMNHHEILSGQALIAYIDECNITLAVTKGGDILVVRNIPIITGDDSDIDSVLVQIAQIVSCEALVTWRKVFGTGIEQVTQIYMMAAGESSDYLLGLIEEKLLTQITLIDCCAMIENLSHNEADIPICVAEGLALRVLAPEQTKGVNFLEDEEINEEPVLNLKKEFVVCATLICVIAVFSLVGLFMRLTRLESAYASIKNETAEIFQKALPQEKVVNPLIQLQQKIESIRGDSRLIASSYVSGLSPLDVLYKISADNPSRENINVDDILINADRVRIKGTCDSFEPVTQWQRFLQEVPAFTHIEVEDIGKQSKSGPVEFTMLLTISKQESK
jgi:Tfp pilus assembly protein PilN